jgi:hypothetical protein
MFPEALGVFLTTPLTSTNERKRAGAATADRLPAARSVQRRENHGRQRALYGSAGWLLRAMPSNGTTSSSLASSR